MLLHTAVGEMVSRTVTVAVQVETFPVLSVAVSVTVFTPMLEQSKASGETTNDDKPQLASEPPFTSSAMMLTFPVPSR